MRGSKKETMMMSKFNTGLIQAALGKGALVLVLAVFAACSNPFVPTDAASGQPASLVLQVASSRSLVGTVLPEAITSADHYEVVLTPTGGTAVTYPVADIAVPLNVPAGTFNIVVRAFNASSQVLGESTSEPIVLNPGVNAYNAVILPLRSGGTGTLAAVFTWPAGPANVTVEICNYPSNVALNLNAAQAATITYDAAFPSATQVSITDLPLPSGDYCLRLHFINNSSQEYAVISAIVQIYDNRRSGSMTPIALTASDLSAAPSAPTGMVVMGAQPEYDMSGGSGATPTPTGMTPTPTGTTPTPTPTGTTPTPTPSTPSGWVHLSWTDNSINESGFRVYKQGDSTPMFSTPYAWAKIQILDATVATTYEVAAYNLMGESSRLTWNYVPVTSLSVSAGSTLNIGQTYPLTATSNATADPQKYAWYSSNPGIASVDSNGVVTAVNPGQATIYARALSGVIGTSSFTVKGMLARFDYESSSYANKAGTSMFMTNSMGYAQPVSYGPDGAYAFISSSGVAGYLNNQSGSPISGDWTVGAWVKPNNAPVGMALLGSSTSSGSLLIGAASTGTPGFITESGTNYLLSGNKLSPNTWTHMVWSKTGTTLSLYLNGSLAQTFAEGTAGEIANLNLPLSLIGARYSAGNLDFLNGYIDDLRVYNYGLSPGEVSALVNVSTQLYGGGSGTLADPYQVATSAHLYNVRYNPSAYYSQMAAITLSSGLGWEPIPAFTGTYNGGNYPIYYVTCTTSSSNQGLFATLSGATVSNLTLSNALISGTDHLGALAGTISGGSITNVTVTAASITGISQLGGLAGSITAGFITSCSSAGTVTANVSSNQVGGLIGYVQSGTVIDTSSSSAVVTANVLGSTDTGGLVGQLYGGDITNSIAAGGSVDGYQNVGGLVGNVSTATALINKCSATIPVTGYVSVGGFAGWVQAGASYNTIQITKSYATGNIVVSNSQAGGFIGLLEGSTVENCYSTTGFVGNNSDTGGVLGGFVGRAQANAHISYCYATGFVNTSNLPAAGFVGDDVNANAQAIGSGNFFDIGATGQSDSWSYVSGQSTANMKTAATYTGWDSTTIWNLVDGLYPTLR